MRDDKILDFDYTKLSLSKSTLQLLQELAFWSLFLSNVGLIVLMGWMLNIVAEQFFSQQLLSFSQIQYPNKWMYWLPVGVLVLPLFYLRSFSLRMKQAVSSKSQSLLDSALLQLKKGYKYLGICVIAILTLWMLSYLFLI